MAWVGVLVMLLGNVRCFLGCELGCELGCGGRKGWDFQRRKNGAVDRLLEQLCCRFSSTFYAGEMFRWVKGPRSKGSWLVNDRERETRMTCVPHQYPFLKAD
jgi:hypothetical protein